jgi:ABC-2 type transport system permease protein
MPEPLATISIFSPATYVIEGIRSALIDGEGFAELWPTMLGLVASGMLMIPLGVYVFSLGERYAKRTGRLKRSG